MGASDPCPFVALYLTLSTLPLPLPSVRFLMSFLRESLPSPIPTLQASEARGGEEEEEGLDRKTKKVGRCAEILFTDIGDRRRRSGGNFGDLLLLLWPWDCYHRHLLPLFLRPTQAKGGAVVDSVLLLWNGEESTAAAEAILHDIVSAASQGWLEWKKLRPDLRRQQGWLGRKSSVGNNTALIGMLFVHPILAFLLVQRGTAIILKNSSFLQPTLRMSLGTNGRTDE